MIIVTLCDDDRPDERKCVVQYPYQLQNFELGYWGFNFIYNNALEMRFQILFQQTADRQQTSADLTQQTEVQKNQSLLFYHYTYSAVLTDTPTHIHEIW